jgi:hypothetical protein
MGAIDYSLRRRVAALEEQVAGGGGSAPPADPTVAGGTRPMSEMFAMPDPTKDYYVTYSFDLPGGAGDGSVTVEIIGYYGVPDGAGWFVTPHAFDVWSQPNNVTKIELKGRVPAGNSVYIVVNQGPGEGYTIAAIETPTS